MYWRQQVIFYFFTSFVENTWSASLSSTVRLHYPIQTICIDIGEWKKVSVVYSFHEPRTLAMRKYLHNCDVYLLCGVVNFLATLLLAAAHTVTSARRSSAYKNPYQCQMFTTVERHLHYQKSYFLADNFSSSHPEWDASQSPSFARSSWLKWATRERNVHGQCILYHEFINSLHLLQVLALGESNNNLPGQQQFPNSQQQASLLNQQQAMLSQQQLLNQFLQLLIPLMQSNILQSKKTQDALDQLRLFLLSMMQPSSSAWPQPNPAFGQSQSFAGDRRNMGGSPNPFEQQTQRSAPWLNNNGPQMGQWGMMPGQMQPGQQGQSGQQDQQGQMAQQSSPSASSQG